MSKEGIEWVYHVDKDDNVIGKVDRDEVVKEKLLKRGVLVFVFNSKREILMHKRTMNKRLYNGYYDIAYGGTVNYGESYDEAAKRELQEETGIKNQELIFLGNDKYEGEEERTFVQVYKCIYDGEIEFNPEEVEFGKFISLEELEKKKQTKTFCPDSIYYFKKYLEEYHGK